MRHREFITLLDAALVAARRGPETLKALAASEQQLAAFDTYVLSLRKRRSRS